MSTQAEIKGSVMDPLTLSIRSLGPIPSGVSDSSMEAFNQWLKGADLTSIQIETAAQDMITRLSAIQWQAGSKQQETRLGRSKLVCGVVVRRAALRRGEYRRIQMKYHRCRRDLAKELLDGTKNMRCGIPMEVLYKSFDKIGGPPCLPRPG